ncbi:MAG: hypothetical protein QHH14_14795 [Clostridiales bacterium]|nr:hypothetical protein [Clostridiales bacterium]
MGESLRYIAVYRGDRLVCGCIPDLASRILALNLKKDSEELHLVAFPPQHQTVDKGHGRLEIRQIRSSPELNRYLEFPYVGQVFCIRREFTRIKSGERSKALPSRLRGSTAATWPMPATTLTLS